MFSFVSQISHHFGFYFLEDRLRPGVSSHLLHGTFIPIEQPRDQRKKIQGTLKFFVFMAFVSVTGDDCMLCEVFRLLSVNMRKSLLFPVNYLPFM